MHGLVQTRYTRRHSITCRIAPQHCHVTFVEPLCTGRVEPCRMLSDIPGTFLRTACPASCSNENHIATFDSNADLFLPSLEIFGIDHHVWFKIRKILQARYVDEYGASENAVLIMCSIELAGSHSVIALCGK